MKRIGVDIEREAPGAEHGLVGAYDAESQDMLFQLQVNYIWPSFSNQLSLLLLAELCSYGVSCAVINAIKHKNGVRNYKTHKLSLVIFK